MVTLWRLLGLVKPHWKAFIAALAALAIGSGINLVFPLIVRSLLENPSIARIEERAVSIAILIFALFAAQALCFYLRSFSFSAIGQRVVTSVRRQLYASLLQKPIEFFDIHRSADLVSRLSNDAMLLQDAVSVRLSVFIRYALQVIVGTALMFYLSPRLSFLIVIVVPLLVGLSLMLGKRLRHLTKQQQQELGISSSIAQETFEAARIVKAFNRESYEIARYAASNQRVLDFGISRAATAAFFSSFVSFLLNCSIVGVLLYGVHLVAAGSMNSGDLMAFLLYGVIVAVSFAFLAAGYTEFVQSLAASERIFEHLDSAAPVEFRGIALQHPAKGHCEFQSVSFAYPARPEVPVLQDLSFSVLPGKSTALVGPSGAGKSTIVSLLLGFYTPTQGRILFDDIDLADLDLHQLRKCLALVPQEQMLFAASIAENLRYGKETASMEELEEVCRRTNMLEFINSLPQAWDTEVGERGLQLSTGQKQRLAIARALLRDPALLILDEATSALDSENEHLVQQALAELLRGRSSVVIAHRLATIKNADQVLVLDRGKIVQRGTHESLARAPGLYRQLVERQELLS